MKEVDVEKLLTSIELQYCSVFFRLHSAKNFITDLAAYLAKTNQSQISGAIYQNDAGDSSNYENLHMFHGSRVANAAGFHAGGIEFQNNNESIEIQLTNVLLSLVKQIELARSAGANIGEALAAQAVMMKPGNDFFAEIARLKSLRVLWKGIAKGYGDPGSELFIHCNATPWISHSYQPHGNLISETTRALSSILGGCDALTLDPENYDELLARIARNTSLVLREESHLSKVADPTAGSYYIDTLVKEITEKSWTEFQRQVR